jgi:nicotinate dehydrogenase subunit A
MTHPAITLRVNGRDHTLQVDPQTPLLYILRNDLGLKAAKFACGLEQCGACKVLFDGVARPSCRLPVAEAQGREIVTLEGLGTPDAPHPVQTAFLAEQAAQCGYCTAGMIVAAAALLDQIPHPTDADIRAALGHHICRCGAYSRILDAVHRAAGNTPQQRAAQEVNA